MEPEGSLPCSQKPDTGHYPEHSFQITINIILSSTSGSQMCLPSLRFPYSNFACILISLSVCLSVTAEFVKCSNGQMLRSKERGDVLTMFIYIKSRVSQKIF
jgi:hypothetical protein